MKTFITVLAASGLIGVTTSAQSVAVEHLDLNWFEYVPGYRTPAGTGTGLSFASWG
jgi:hypothetical protein